MRRERILKLELDEAVNYFSGRKWKLFQILDNEHGQLLTFEVPVSESESYFVELRFNEKPFFEESIRALKADGWIEQEIRMVP